MAQFVVDMYAKVTFFLKKIAVTSLILNGHCSVQVETERLGYQRQNQKRLRAESYTGVLESLQDNVALENVGVPVVLSPSFTGGPR